MLNYENGVLRPPMSGEPSTHSCPCKGGAAKSALPLGHEEATVVMADDLTQGQAYKSGGSQITDEMKRWLKKQPECPSKSDPMLMRLKCLSLGTYAGAVARCQQQMMNQVIRALPRCPIYCQNGKRVSYCRSEISGIPPVDTRWCTVRKAGGVAQISCDKGAIVRRICSCPGMEE